MNNRMLNKVFFPAIESSCMKLPSNSGQRVKQNHLNFMFNETEKSPMLQFPEACFEN
jgi:hypothetical protein